MEEFKVKGTSISSKLAYIQARFGEAAEKKFVESFAHQNVFPVLDSLWYPFSLYENILKAIADQFYMGDLSQLKDVGTFSADSVLTSVYSSYVTGKQFSEFLERVSALHTRFYNMGELIVEFKPEEKTCRFTITGQPFYSEADMYVGEGFYVGFAKIFGYNNVHSVRVVEDEQVYVDLHWT